MEILGGRRFIAICSGVKAWGRKARRIRWREE
jgi:hypothetical protein